MRRGSGSTPQRRWSATSAGGASTPWRWGSRPTGSIACSPITRTHCAPCATSASAWSIACPCSSACSSARRLGSWATCRSCSRARGCSEPRRLGSLQRRRNGFLHLNERVTLQLEPLHFGKSHMQVKADGIDHALVGYELHAAATLVACLGLSELNQCTPIAVTLKLGQDGYELELHELPMHIQPDRCGDETLGLEHPERTTVYPLRNVHP